MTNAEHLALKVATRTLQKKHVKALRSKHIIPGVVYGSKTQAQSIEMPLQDLTTVYSKGGESTLIDLSIDNQNPIKVVIQAIDRNFVSHDIEHVDFYAVDMAKTIHAEVILHFTGESPAVKGLGGTLVKNRDHITIKCLPQDLVSEITIDISGLKTFEDAIHINDLNLPSTVEILDATDETIALVAPPRSEEELAALNEVASEDISKVEGVVKEEKEKKDEAAPETKTTSK